MFETFGGLKEVFLGAKSGIVEGQTRGCQMSVRRLKSCCKVCVNGLSEVYDGALRCQSLGHMRLSNVQNESVERLIHGAAKC